MKILLNSLLFCLFLLVGFSSCEKEDPCQNVTCINGGTCVNGACNCPSGYSGSDCSIPPDPCAGITCLNGGNCINGTCNCPTGFGGSDCSVVLTPTSMIVNKIEVSNYPTLKPSGSGWDLTSGADLYLVFAKGTSTSYSGNPHRASSTVQDVTGQSLEWTLSPTYTVNSVSENWSMMAWDADSPDPDDYMAGFFFKPLDQVTASGYPSTFTVTGADLTARFHVTWTF